MDLLLRSCTTLYVSMLDLVTSSSWNSGGVDVGMWSSARQMIGFIKLGQTCLRRYEKQQC